MRWCIAPNVAQIQLNSSLCSKRFCGIFDDLVTREMGSSKRMERRMGERERKEKTFPSSLPPLNSIFRAIIPFPLASPVAPIFHAAKSSKTSVCSENPQKNLLRRLFHFLWLVILIINNEKCFRSTIQSFGVFKRRKF